MTVTANPGVMLLLNGKEVLLAPKDVTDAKKNGVHFVLDDKVDLWTLDDLSGFLSNIFAATAPSADNLPAPLSTAYTGLSSLHLAIEKFTLDIPPSVDANGTPIGDNQRKPMQFNVGISATLKSPVTIIGGLIIQGIYLEVNKDDKP